MDDSTRTSIITAAVIAAGPADSDPVGWMSRVEANAAQIAAMCSPGSSVAAVIDGVASSKVFVATITNIRREASSTRGVVTLQAKPSKFHPDGIEEARTERTDNPVGLLMAQRLQKLVSHRVKLWIEVEEIQGGAGKVRVIRHVEDLGVVADDVAA